MSDTKWEVATELEYLRFFHKHVKALFPEGHELEIIIRDNFEELHNKLAPEGY